MKYALTAILLLILPVIALGAAPVLDPTEGRGSGSADGADSRHCVNSDGLVTTVDYGWFPTDCATILNMYSNRFSASWIGNGARQ